MKHKLYLECYSGISGDMVVAALLDLGADRNVLLQVLDSVQRQEGIQPFTIKVSEVVKMGLHACDFDVCLAKEYENHDHDMNYLFGKEVDSIHDTGHKHEHHTEHHAEGHHIEEHHTEEHHTEEHHTEEHHHAHHIHRGLKEVLDIIEHATMTDGAANLAKKIFHILGEAEAQAHGTTIDQVHFHEVGAIDSIVDIISAAVCLDNLNLTEAVIPVLYEGSGTIRCQHGILPIPVPAVSAIVSGYGLPIHMTGRAGELVTPTGAAIAAAIGSTNQLPDHFRIVKMGIGAGKREYEQPSLLRAMLIEETNLNPKKDIDAVIDKELDNNSNKDRNKNTDRIMHSESPDDGIYKLESNIDDCSGEALGYCMDRLLKEGARDVHYLPVYMKKNRPAYQLIVICDECDIAKMEQIIFEETTTIGIRRQKMERTVLKRTIKEVETTYGRVHVKFCETKGFSRAYPEYEDIVAICSTTGLSYQHVYDQIRMELVNME